MHAPPPSPFRQARSSSGITLCMAALVALASRASGDAILKLARPVTVSPSGDVVSELSDDAGYTTFVWSQKTTTDGGLPLSDVPNNHTWSVLLSAGSRCNEFLARAEVHSTARDSSTWGGRPELLRATSLDMTVKLSFNTPYSWTVTESSDKQGTTTESSSTCTTFTMRSGIILGMSLAAAPLLLMSELSLPVVAELPLAQSTPSHVHGRHLSATTPVKACADHDTGKTITCPSGLIITSVIGAFYGFGQGSCGSYTSTCGAGVNITTYVAATCFGLSTCTLVQQSSWAVQCSYWNVPYVSVNCLPPPPPPPPPPRPPPPPPTGQPVAACADHDIGPTITCPSGLIITSITQAFYGFGQGSCGSYVEKV